MVYCFKNGVRKKVTSGLLMSESVSSSPGYSPQMTSPLTSNTVDQPLMCYKRMVKCFLIFILMMIIIFY